MDRMMTVMERGGRKGDAFSFRVVIVGFGSNGLGIGGYFYGRSISGAHVSFLVTA